jgi:ABC-type transport system substrate-binding protein
MVVACVGLLLLSLNTPYHDSIPLNGKTWTYPSGYDPHGGYVDRITFIVYPSEDIAQALLALQQGLVSSYDEQIPLELTPELVANPAVEVSSELGASYRHFTLQCQRFPTNMTGYRLALAYALDKSLVVERAQGGLAQPMDNPIPLPYDFWTFEGQMTSHFYAEDIVSANATLDATHIIDTPDSPHPGWRYYDADMSGDWSVGDRPGNVMAPFGLKIELLASIQSNPAIQACLTQLEGMEKCGLQGELVEFDPDVLFWSPFSGGEWNFGCLRWYINPPGIPILLDSMFHSEGRQNSYWYRLNNSQYDYNCTMFMTAPTRLEARNWAWNCCRILMEEMPMIVCYNEEYTHAYRTDIWEGFVNQVGMNRMGGNSYTYQSIRLKPEAGGPFGCLPTDYVTVLSDGMDFRNTILSNSKSSQIVFNLIYSQLWRIDPLDPLTRGAPDLAYGWSLEHTNASGDVQEGMKYTFHLYENITWHDGTPFTSEDVQYSLMTIHPRGTYTADNVVSIYRVDTPNEHTVEIFSNSSGYVTFTEATSIQILPKHIWSQYEPGNFTWSPETQEELTGTGCYKWNTRVAGQYIILDRYEDWHFTVTHPERTPCRGPGGPPFFLPVWILSIVIVVQVIILIILLKRRHDRGKTYPKKGYAAILIWRGD